MINILALFTIAVIARTDSCDAPILRDIPRDAPSNITVPPPNEPGVPLVIRGRVLDRDRKTPIVGALIYVYHTNAAGRYPKRAGLCGAARWHGYLRGYVRTDSAGRYEIITVRPGTYPEMDTPAHIHPNVAARGQELQDIEDFTFADDPLVTSAYRRSADGRGGSGVLTLTRRADGVWEGYRDIILGLGYR